LVFKLLGHRYSIDVHERVEMANIATGERLHPSKWSLGNGCVKTPMGFTPRYFEVRNDTNERMKNYSGLVDSVIIG
jgi:hypothetical protein